VTRPEVNAGPIERILSPLNVGVDIGSRGVGDASGVGDGDGLAVALGDGDGVAGGRGGSCAITRSGSRNKSEITVNAHEDIVITFLLVVIEMELVETDLWFIRHRLTRITLINAGEGTRLCDATRRPQLRRCKLPDAGH
jgi:hypothetical protein